MPTRLSNSRNLFDRPLTASDLKRMRRTPHAKIVRRALGLTQEEFLAHYRLDTSTFVH